MPSSDILIVLASLRAEGTPRMALSMCRRWKAQGLRVTIIDFGVAQPELQPNFEELGIPIERVQVQSSGYRRYLDLTTAVRSLCKREQPRAVLCMPMGLHSFVAAGARSARVARVCAHVGNPPHPGSMSRLALRKAQAIVQLGRPFTHRLVCCSHYVKRETMQHLLVSEKETEVIYNGVDVEPFAIAQRERGVPQKPERWVVGMVATLEGHKDQETLVRAAARVRDMGVSLEVRLIGEGARRPLLARVIEELSAPVTLMGSRSDIVEQVAAMDIFAFSTTEREGLGIALIEAMAAGVPVVASDVPACREVLDSGALGRLVRAGDPAALAQGIFEMTLDYDASLKLAERARSKVLLEFTAENMADRYLEVMDVAPPG